MTRGSLGLWIGVGTAVMLMMITGAAGVIPAQSQADEHYEPLSVDNTVTESIGYQGYLTDNNGASLNGIHPMRFELFRAVSGGSSVYTSPTMNVPVEDGLFDVGLNAPQSLFDGSPLWLAITVNGETLSPRQEIRPAPYAMSLRPGAVIHQAATGTALRAESSQGIGLRGAGQVYGIYATNTGEAPGHGYGGYFESTTGIGIYGASTAQPSTQNNVTPGVHGHSEYGAGVYGTSNSSFGVGIYGQMATGTAVYGSSGGDGVVGQGRARGVYGVSTAPTQGSGYGGYFSSSTGVGVYGQSTAQTSSQNMFAPGIFGYSQHGAGVLGRSGASGVAGFFDGTVVVAGDLFVTGSKGGYVADIARNDGTEPLSQGDLVVVTGVTTAVVGNIPVPLVRKADAESGTAVIGVVDAHYQVSENGAGHIKEAAVEPGEYVSIVTLGAFEAIKVDATYGAVQPGDLLVASPTAGHAMRADDPVIGTVIGKALGGLDDGTGVIAVMITLQ